MPDNIKVKESEYYTVEETRKVLYKYYIRGVLRGISIGLSAALVFCLVVYWVTA